MHGCKPGSALLVNAEVDSMGGVVDGAVGIGVKTSPRRAAIEKAQEELRQEYDVREERRRELEFLEKGGNPLDFKFGNATSVSVQSTSLIDQQVEHIVTSEAKASFALTASPHGDSVESSGRPRVLAVCEPNSADNLLLFDDESELPEGERKSIHHRKRNSVVPSEQSSRMNGTQNAKESEDSAIFRPYARRNRSKINREGTRSSSTDIAQGRGGHGSSLPMHGAPAKGVNSLVSETNNQKDKNIPFVNNTKSAISNGDLAPEGIKSDNQLTMELDGGKVAEELCNKPAQVEAQKSPINQAYEEPDLVVAKQQVVSTGLECATGACLAKAENESDSNQLNGFSDATRERISIPNDEKNSRATIGMKGLDSESSCTQNSLALDVNNDNDVFINPKNVESNSYAMEKTLEIVDSLNLGVGELPTEKKEMKAVYNVVIARDTNASIIQNHSINDSIVKMVEEITSELQNEVTCPSSNEVQQRSHAVSEADMKVSIVPADDCNSKKENISTSRPRGMEDNFISEISDMTLSGRTPTANPQSNSDDHVKVVDKAREDSILEEARIIEAKRKRIAELSVGTLPLESYIKSRWDFVLEEMAWLANDFAQERLWKLTAASQICRRVAFSSRLKFEEQNQYWKLRRVALTLSNAVMEFWHSAEVLLNYEEASLGSKKCDHDLVGPGVIEAIEVCNKTAELNMDINKEDQWPPGKNNQRAIRAYALRFLKYSSFPVPLLPAEAPVTPDRISDLGIMDISWDEHLTEESLFYAVPSGAMEIYRRSIESHLVQIEKTGGSVQEEGETSVYDTGAEFGCHDFVYDEDEGETSTYYLPGAFEGSKPSNLKKRKNPMKSYPARPYEMGVDQPYANCTQQSMPTGRRPASSLNVSPIPTKRVRTGSRQRVLSPFGCAAAAGCVQPPTKADASSGDTSSFQDDQSTLHGGFQIQKSMEVESVGDFERQLLYDSAETPTKPKKKKTAKILGSTYDQDWQLESTVHSEQRGYSKKRLESHHFDSNGTNGLYGQHNAKKPKIMKQQQDNSLDITPSVSIPSPVGSQMSNMSNPNKFIKIIQSCDRGRKPKTPKMSANQSGSGCPWSLFEDQALVVLVHDLGPNWELISDAINSTFQFKCIFRKPKECKERHKILMDKSGDGGDSADDSGSSQSYPSTLPGIPKGSARQLFQRLQGPMEEDTLKSHFEQIVLIGKKQLYRQSQNDNQELKQIVPVHNSHDIALSQVCPNNLNGGVLTPLDLCDATPSSQDILPLGYQASYASGLAISNQAAVGSMLPSLGVNPSLRESSGMVLGNNFSPSSASVNASGRDGRYGVPRTSMPADEQHRMQQYNQMLSGRNTQQSNLSVPGAISGSDRGVRMLPGGNGMGMMCGMNRSMPISRPGFQGTASSTMLNSGSMLSSNMVGMASPLNVHSGPGSGQGNSMLRPRDAMHMMRPGYNPDHQRQLKAPELQMQAQANGQGVPPFNGLSSAYPNQSNASPVQPFPGHLQQQQQQHPISPQQSHPLSNSHHAHLQGSNSATGSQQQAYAMRFAKERQMQKQQRIMQQHQQQQQFSASSTLMPHVQPQTQLPLSSLQNSSQIQSQASSQPVSLSPLTPSSPMTPMTLQHQQKHHLPPHGLGRNSQPCASGLTNQIGKPRQRPQQHQQQFQQSGRHHPQQRQQTQSQQQAKLLKVVGRGNMLVQQNLSVDPGHLNGLNMVPGSQAVEKGEQMVHLVQGQGLYPGTSMSPVQTSKPLVSSQSSNLVHPQQNLFSGATSPSTKQLQQVASHSDNSTQGQVSSVPSGHTVSAVNQSVLPAATGPNHHHLQLQTQPHQKHVNQNQAPVQRMLQQNRHVNSDPPCISQAESAQADQQTMNKALPMGTTTNMAMPLAGTDSGSNPIPVVSQWKSSEPVCDPSMTNVTTQVGSMESSPLKNSAVNDPVSPGNNAGVQWPQQPQIPQSSTKLPSQQHYQPQEQLQQDQYNSPPQQLPLQQSHQQTPHLQAVQGNLYHRPSNSKLE